MSIFTISAKAVSSRLYTTEVYTLRDKKVSCAKCVNVPGIENEVELIPAGGGDIAVIDANRTDYANLYLDLITVVMLLIEIPLPQNSKCVYMRV